MDVVNSDEHLRQLRIFVYPSLPRFPDTSIQNFRGPAKNDGVNGAEPSMYTLYNLILFGGLPLLEFHYFRVAVGSFIFFTSLAHGLVGGWEGYVGKYV